MPVLQQDWDLTMEFPFLSEGLDLFENLNLSPLGELWKTELESLSDAWNLQDDSWNLDCKRGTSMIRVHDCMWAGTCGSKDHVGRKPTQNETNRSSSSSSSSSSNCTSTTHSNGSVNSCSSPIRIPSNKSALLQPIPSPSRSLIKKPSIPAPTKVLHRPDTPQSEDDLSKTPDDHELSWTRGVAVSEITGQRRTETTNIVTATATTIQSSVSFDHNYNTKKPSKHDDLGVVTPSDSEEDEEESEEEDSQSSEVEDQEEDEEEDDEEEEIDVVSLKESSPPRKKMADRRMHRQEEWRSSAQEWSVRRPEILRPEPELRLGLSQQEQNAFKFASQKVSKRISAENNRVGRGRQKRKRLSSDEEDPSKTVDYMKADSTYKPNYRRTNTTRPRNTTRRKYTTPSKKTRISTDSETDTTEKRSQHNDMERKRRIDLRNAFEDLRSLVPSLADAARAAKVTILRDAASYCLQLTSNSKTLQSQVGILRREQEKLRSNLSKLRRHIAHKHVGPNVR